MRRSIPIVRKSVIPKHLTPKIRERNSTSILNLLNLEKGSLIAVPSQYNLPNVVRLHEDVISISDADSAVFHEDIDKGSAM